jgi:tRNA 2-selenouridine synthase SelU
MNTRAFDPVLLDRIDDGFAANEDDDFTLVEQCTICGKTDLVFEDDRLVDLEGEPHECPESSPSS